MAFTISKNLVFIDRMQFKNSSLNKLVKTLTGNAFKYLSEEFSCDLLELVKHKRVYPYFISIVYPQFITYEQFSEDELADRCEIFSSVKNKHISEKTFTCCQCLECI